ncbi:FHA domain-containing protein [Occultella kanbiaonis]|uniref:FHA domain-containing protein n=1 Tax=Occultella kanbiaonis TaxID=2675754 RepID=UPI0012B964FD|nr:FHA domain-containing protein [Occultella kanbiaonis]
MSLEYVPGEWTGLATGTGVVLLAPTVPPATVRAVWEALAAGRPITHWLEIIAGGGISSLPAFGLVERTPDGVRVLLRGDVVVDVDGTEVAARGMSTWREVLVDAATDIVVRTPGTSGASGTSSTGGPVGSVGESWPLLGGVVRAARIRVDLADAAPVAAVVAVAGAGASAEAPVAVIEESAPPVAAPVAAGTAPALPTDLPTVVADVELSPPAAETFDKPVADVPEHRDDESVSLAEPVDVFEEAGFGPAADGADDGVDEHVDVEPDRDAASAVSAEPHAEGETASAEAPEAGPEAEDASAEALETGLGAEGASAEERESAFGVDVSAGALEPPAEAEDEDASAEALERGLGAEGASAEERESAFGVDVSAGALEPPAEAEAEDASAEAPVPAFGVAASAEEPVPGSGVRKHAAGEPNEAAPDDDAADDAGASAEAPSLSDGDADDQAHHETYVGPLPDIAPGGAVEPELPEGGEPGDVQEPPDEPAASEAPESGTVIPTTSGRYDPAEDPGVDAAHADSDARGVDAEADAADASGADADADAADANRADAYAAGDQGEGESPVPPRPPEGTSTAEYEQVGPVSSGLIDSLPWNMPNARAADARPAAPSPVPAFDPPTLHTSVPPAAGGGDAEIEGDHDGETILVSHLRSAYAQDAADAVPNQPPSATIVPGVADDALYDEPGPVIMLAVSSGPRVPLDRVVLIGRAPESSRFAGALMPRLVTVPSPQQDISRTHVEVRLEGDHVVVTDLRSTNGTMVAVPGNDPRRLHPGEGVPVPVGSLIDLGDGITIGVESSGPPHGQGH